MKIQSIIDFSGMKFRTERAVDRRLRGKVKMSSRTRTTSTGKHLTRNVRGALDQLLGW